MLIRISSELFVNDQEIKFVVPVNSNAAKTIMQEAQKNNNVLRFTRGKAARVLICLRDDRIILTNVSMATIVKKMNTSNDTNDDSDD